MASSSRLPKLWTFSGINSWSESGNAYVDYTWEALRERLSHPGPERRYASRLGTHRDHYHGSRNVLRFHSRRILDEEATELAERGDGRQPGIEPGGLRDQRVAALLLAPKTNTPPPRSQNLRLMVYWSPYDSVPNQGLAKPITLTGWRRHAGPSQVYAIRTSEGKGLNRSHDIRGFLVPRPPLVKYLRRRSGSGFVREWRTYGPIAPSSLTVLKEWLADDSLDLVMVGHSQGTNILSRFLKRGFDG